MVLVYFILQHWAKVYWHVQNPGWQVCVNWWSFFLIKSVTDIITLFGGKIREHDRMNKQLLKLVGGGNIKATCHSRTQLGRWSIGLWKITLLWIPHCLVSDQGTCKNKRVKQKDQSAFGWTTEISGDLHTKGHLCETTFQAQGKGGFHHLITKL